MGEETITILCSGIALGVYVPALIVNSQLRARGFSSELVVLESMIFEEKRKNISRTKTAFHRNLKIALMGQKLARYNISTNIDQSLIWNILIDWKKEKRRIFIVFSGFWMPILEEYLQEINSKDIIINLCHMDSVPSVSWKSINNNTIFNHIWFFNWKKKSVDYCIYISKDKPLSYKERLNRFVIHGGGWGIGTYSEKIPSLERRGFKLDIIAYEWSDIKKLKEGNRYFMIDPEWKSWEKDINGYHQFPPFGEVKNKRKVIFQYNKKYPGVYHLIQQSKAIISKPGGATLMDSLSSATPLILLDPFGKYEKKNALLWEHLGFGISYKEWIKSNCSIELLEQLHINILRERSKIKDYVEII